MTNDSAQAKIEQVLDPHVLSTGRSSQLARIIADSGIIDELAEARAIGYHDSECTVVAEWADYFEHWGSTVGSPRFTQEAVVAALRGPRPFGTACGNSELPK